MQKINNPLKSGSNWTNNKETKIPHLKKIERARYVFCIYGISFFIAAISIAAGRHAEQVFPAMSGYGAGFFMIVIGIIFFTVMYFLGKVGQEIIRERDLQKRALDWIANKETGISSLTIWAVMMDAVDLNNKDSQADYDVPYDPDDFRRCRELLDYIPEWRERLPEVAEKFSEWKPLVENWNKLDTLYDEEAPSGSAPNLYTLLDKLAK